MGNDSFTLIFSTIKQYVYLWVDKHNRRFSSSVYASPPLHLVAFGAVSIIAKVGDTLSDHFPWKMIIFFYFFIIKRYVYLWVDKHDRYFSSIVYASPPPHLFAGGAVSMSAKVSDDHFHGTWLTFLLFQE